MGLGLRGVVVCEQVFGSMSLGAVCRVFCVLVLMGVVWGCGSPPESGSGGGGVVVPPPLPTTRPVVSEPVVSVVSSVPVVSVAGSGGGLSAEEVYERVAPSVVFVETGKGSGSGVLVEGGWVVTNHHVVWPYSEVWVVFPDGLELEGVPVVGWDPFTDLAVLGPVSVGVEPLVFGDGEGLVPGSDVFLVGYPAEVELFPKASITRGILSRVREWGVAGMTYLQTDAGIAGGQSGGALVNDVGEVIGISTYSFSEAGFGLASSSVDNLGRVEGLLGVGADGPSRFGLGSGGGFEFVAELEHEWDGLTYVLEGVAGSSLWFSVEGGGDTRFRVCGPSGLLGVVDERVVGGESGSVGVGVGGPHFLFVESVSGGSDVVLGKSGGRVVLVEDLDDGRGLVVGGVVSGVLEHCADSDWYRLFLGAGETVLLRVESLGFDPVVYVDDGGVVVSDDDGGGGLSGQDAGLVFEAVRDGVVFVVVGSGGELGGMGGYFLSVSGVEGSGRRVLGGVDGFRLFLGSEPVFGGVDVDVLVGLGVSVCDGLDAGVGWDEVVGVVVGSGLGWDMGVVVLFLGGVVGELCPVWVDGFGVWSSGLDVPVVSVPVVVGGVVGVPDVFEEVVSSDVGLRDVDRGVLREVALGVCVSLEGGESFESVGLGLVLGSGSGWGMESAGVLLAAAVMGFCPEFEGAMLEWVEGFGFGM